MRRLCHIVRDARPLHLEVLALGADELRAQRGAARDLNAKHIVTSTCVKPPAHARHSRDALGQLHVQGRQRRARRGVRGRNPRWGKWQGMALYAEQQKAFEPCETSLRMRQVPHAGTGVRLKRLTARGGDLRGAKSELRLRHCIAAAEHSSLSSQALKGAEDDMARARKASKI
eukprot:6201851-Pleurochrysis_carterae.AAC.1